MNNKVGLKARVQKVGSTLSGMVMPNIGAFIAWGIITALFIPSGWFPNSTFNELVSPMLTYLLPLLIGFTGGSMIYDGHRGGVVGAIATVGVIAGADIPMFLGAMIMGPLGGYVIKKWDQIVQPKIRQGFEMLVNNFSAGILGGILALIGIVAIGPLVTGLSNVLQAGVNWIIAANLLPLANVFIEPAKILFLNNAINQGILTPLGVQQAADAGKSILFLLEPNPGPGIGVLLAFMFFGKGAAKASAPGAAIIQFFGGIHEIYFPYVLSKPALLLAVIAGGVSGTATFQLLHVGLKATASPGSIFAILLMTPKGIGNFVGVLTGILVAAVVSFVIAAIILGRSKDDIDLAAAQAANKARKAESKGLAVEGEEAAPAVAGDFSNVKQVIFACEAGMGSSAMGASLLRNRVKEAGLDIPVTNLAIRNLKAGADTLVVTQNELAEMASTKAPDATRVAVENFLNSPKYDEIIDNLTAVKNGTYKTEAAAEAAPAAPAVEATPAAQDGVNWSAVKHIHFVNDGQHLGSTTMAAAELVTRVADVTVATTLLPDFADDAASLAVVTADVAAKLGDYKQAQVMTVDSIMSEQVWQEIAKGLKGEA